MRANIPGRGPSRFARDLVTAGNTRCPCQRPPAPPSWTMPTHIPSEVEGGPGGVGEAAGNVPRPIGEVPPAIRETSASTSLRAPLATSCSCSCSVAKSSPVAAPAPTEGSDAGGVGDAPTTAGDPTPLPLTCVPPVSFSCSCSVAKSSPVAAPAQTEGSDAGGVGGVSTIAGGPTPLPLLCDPPVTSAAGTAAGTPPPREDVTAAAHVAAAPDEEMEGMPSLRGAADAAGARVDENARRTPSPRAKLSKMPSPPPPLPMKTWEE